MHFLPRPDQGVYCLFLFGQGSLSHHINLTIYPRYVLLKPS